MENKKIITIFIIVLSVVLIYQFIIRPIQKDNKLEKCLYGAGVTLEPGDTYQRYEKSCIEKYGR